MPAGMVQPCYSGMIDLLDRDTIYVENDFNGGNAHVIGETPNKLINEKSPTCSSTPTIPWIGFRGARKHLTSYGRGQARISFHRLSHLSLVPRLDGIPSRMKRSPRCSRKICLHQGGPRGAADIDSVYMGRLPGVHRAGGWPLTIVMTPSQSRFLPPRISLKTKGVLPRHG